MVNGFMTAMISNLFLNLSRPCIPSKIFSDSEEAMVWYGCNGSSRGIENVRDLMFVVSMKVIESPYLTMKIENSILVGIYKENAKIDLKVARK